MAAHNLVFRQTPKVTSSLCDILTRSRSTIEFIGLREKTLNPNFKGVEFDSFLFKTGN